MEITEQKRTVALVANTAWSLYNFRLGLIRKLLKSNFKVLIVAPEDKYVAHLIDEGCLYEPIKLDNYGTNPLKDLKSLFQFTRIYRKHTIDFIFHYTIKPNIYGSLAAGYLKIPSIAVVTGLGQLFTIPSWKTTIAKMLYWLSFRKTSQVWFLNESDASIFIQMGILQEEKVKYLPSEGINTKHFQQYAYGLLSNGCFKFILAARLITEKGIREYAEAARTLIKKGYQAEFQLLGFLEPNNPHAINRKEVEQWEAEGIIRYLGDTDDIRPFLEKADCLVLPTYYREGVPRILMEGASMQMPLIATDNVGCRLVVEDSINGYLCQKKNANDLAHCMEKMMMLSFEERAKYGLLGRRRVYTLFHESIIVKKYLRTLNSYFEEKTTDNVKRRFKTLQV